MRRLALGVFLGVVGLLALVGYGIANRGVTVQAEPAALRTGRPAADFSVDLFSGGSLRLSEQRGKAVLVNFWASWCPPCRDEAKVLEQAWLTYRDRGAVFVGVDIWDSEPDARSFLAQYGVTYPNGPDPTGEIAIEYGVVGVPETWLIDKEGRLLRRWTGPLTERQISTLMEEALR